jgi:hypothetical protein
MVWAVSLSTMKLISHSLTPKHHYCGILSLIGFGNPVRPLAHSVLYLRITNLRLALKLFRGEPAISEFDWNFSATHSSSQTFSTVTWFGPPRDFTLASTCPWVGHSVSGLLHATLRPIQTRFPFGSVPSVLNLATYNNSLDRSTKSTLSSLNALQLLVNIGFQVLFHSPPGVLFTFPSRYFSTIGYQVVFSLGRWSSQLHTGFLVPCATPDTDRLLVVSCTGLLPSLVATFQ